MARRELVEVAVEGEDSAVGNPPRLPRGYDDDPHGQQRTGASVVICCRDRAMLLATALPAVQSAMRPQDELVVVDSASRTSDVRDVAEAAGARIVRCERPGLGRARNAGWTATDRDVVLFTDDDCRPSPVWVDAGVRALAAPRVGVAWGRVDADVPAAVELSILDEHGPTEGSLDGDLSALGHGANMAFRREVLEQLGGFDPLLGAGGRFPAGEDKDAFWRAMRAGWRAVFAPDLQVTHVTWRGDVEAVRVMFRYGVGAGAVVAKRRRLAAERGLAAQEVWRHGLLPAARAARRGRWGACAGALARSAGVVEGAVRARRLPLADGRLVDLG